MYHYTDGGLRNVWLANGYEERDTPHGRAVAIRDIDGLTAAICLAFTNKPKALTGTEFRYIRSAGLLLSQAALGKAVGADAQSVARWEKTSRPPKWADKLLRLVYLAHSNGNVRLRSALETLKAVERVMDEQDTKVIIEATEGHWQPRLERATEDELECA